MIYFAILGPSLASLALTYVVSLGGLLQLCSAEVESLVSTVDCCINLDDYISYYTLSDGIS